MIRVGIGGWVFKPWRGTFYPRGLPQAQELNYASRHVTSIEINATFYRTQAPASFRRWRDETPDGFVFALKAPRLATHRRVLADGRSSVEWFIGSGILELGDKLGPILWQLPPFKRFDEKDIAAFLELLPAKADGRRLRHAIEAGHESFAAPAFLDLVRKHNAAAVMVDDDKRPTLRDVTADFVYARLRRSQAAEPAGYPPKDIDAWAKTFRSLADGGKRDCFVYFISGAKERAPAAAQALLKRLGAR